MADLVPRARLGRLRVLVEDLACWRIRSWVDVAPWWEAGRPVPAGAPWADHRRVYSLRCPAVVVPDEWPVADARLTFNGSGHGLVRLTAAGGAVVHPLNDRHHTVALPDRRCQVEAQLAPVRDSDTGYVTVGSPWEVRLVWLDRAVDECCRLLAMVCDAVEALAGQPASADLMRVAERALAGIEWPSATTAFVSRVATVEHLRLLWSPVKVDEHPAGLTESQRASVARAVVTVREALSELTDRYPIPHTLSLCGGAHVDIAWLWPEAVSRPAVVGQFAGVLDQLDRFPEYRFGQSSAHLYHIVEQESPELFRRLREQVAAGRWELLGGMWVEPDVNLPCGESIVRQLWHAQRYFADKFGRRSTVCWLPDTFGFPGTLPQLLAGAGIAYFFTTKLRYQDTNRFPFDLFRWEGDDGTRVLAAMGDGPCGYRGVPEPSTVLTTWEQWRQKEIHHDVLLPLGHSSGINPTDAEITQALDLPMLPGLPRARFSSVAGFFRRADEATDGRPLPVWAGELYLEAHRGTFTAQGRTKVAHRRAEWSLLAAETVGAMWAIRSGVRPPDLLRLWRRLLSQQTHDIVTGASIAEVHDQAERLLGDVAAEAQRLIAATIRQLTDDLGAAGEGSGVLVANPTLSVRRVRAMLPPDCTVGQPVAGGRVVVTADRVPPLGVSWQPVASGPGVEVAGAGMENEAVRLTIADDGTLASVWDKRLGREMLAGPGNALTAYLDRSPFWDAWELTEGYEGFRLEPVTCTGVEVCERGPHRAAIRVRRRFRDSSIVQDIRLWAGSARIDVATTIDWHERRVLLRAYFPVAVRAAYATCECPYGTVRRPTRAASSYDRARFEIPAHRFVDLSDDRCGVALLNNGRYGHRVDDTVLSLSLLRSPVFPDPLADEGVHRFTYALFPHQGGWWEGGVLAEAEDLNMPLPAIPCGAVSYGAWQAVELGADGLALGAFTRGLRRDGLLLRVYEPAGKSVLARPSAPAGWRFAAELNLLEDEVGQAQFGFAPYQIRTWLLTPEG